MQAGAIMRCEQASELFNSYLDGDLAPSLATELAAHCLQCPDCRQSLALVEVTGHLISTDDEPVVLDEGFTDRLMACLDTPAPSRIVRFRRYVNIGAPIAAAAAIVLLLLGVFDQKTMVAGRKEFAPTKASSIVESAPADAAGASETRAPAAVPVRWENLPRAIERLLAPQGPVFDDSDVPVGGGDVAHPAEPSASSVEDL